MKEDKINFQQQYIFPLTYINYVTKWAVDSHNWCGVKSFKVNINMIFNVSKIKVMYLPSNTP